MVLPEISWLLPLRVTVPVPGVNTPPAFDQLPDTVKVPEGAVNVPLIKSKFPVTVKSVAEPVNVPPLIRTPPTFIVLEFCKSVPAPIIKLFVAVRFAPSVVVCPEPLIVRL